MVQRIISRRYDAKRHFSTTPARKLTDYHLSRAVYILPRFGEFVNSILPISDKICKKASSPRRKCSVKPAEFSYTDTKRGKPHTEVYHEDRCCPFAEGCTTDFKADI